MNPNKPKALIPTKRSSLITSAFLVSIGLMMSHEVFAKTYLVGDEGPSGAGTIVFYVDGTGKHGLEAIDSDYSETGLPQTFNWDDAIANAASYNSPSCPTDPQLTPWCWHLPTKTELELLYEQRNVVSNNFNKSYWSSTEAVIDSSKAWNQRFSDGIQGYNDKISYLSVRFVRVF